MPEVAREGLQPIAFLYGDAGAAAHLREALDGQVEIAYAATATEFDAQRASAAGVTAALVNVDGGEWLEALEAALADAGVRAVFNDPEISAHLEGWERARWLRHLVAKLRGGNDFDPPRPVAIAEPAPATAAAAEVPAAPGPATVVERPLSPEEIDSLTADFAAAPNVDDAEPAVAAPADALDIDTEALSALIDARLAEPEPGEAHSAGLAHDGLAIVALDAAAAVAPARAAEAQADPEASLESALPAAGEWELVEAGYAHPLPAPAPRPAVPAPELGASLADLTLVPLEVAGPTLSNTDPIERWLDDAKPAGKARSEAAGAKA